MTAISIRKKLIEDINKASDKDVKEMISTFCRISEVLLCQNDHLYI